MAGNGLWGARGHLGAVQNAGVAFAGAIIRHAGPLGIHLRGPRVPTVTGTAGAAGAGRTRALGQ